MNFFDIETIPQSEERVNDMMPDEIKNPVMPQDLRHPQIPHFENRALKDPAKIEVWKADKERDWKAAHKAKIEKWNIETMDKRSHFHERAALNPETGQIAVIGYGYSANADRVLAVNAAIAGAFLDVKKPKNFKVMSFKDESELLLDWLSSMEDHCGKKEPDIAGFGIKNFDLPFIRKRCWLLGVPFPRFLSGGRIAGYMWDSNFIDLQEVWGSGDRTCRVSQDYLSTVFGLPLKPDEGRLFWKHFRDDITKAFNYAAHDIQSLVTLGDKMGIERKASLGLE